MARPDKKIKIFGEVFAEGIWIYVVDIAEYGKRKFIYVGKTGWKNVPKNSSPWQRLAGHLDSEAESGNCLYTHLQREGVDVDRCTFELSCFGPNLSGTAGPYTKVDHEIIEEAEGQVADAVAQVYPLIGSHEQRHPKLEEKAKPIAQKILRTLGKSYLKKLKN